MQALRAVTCNSCQSGLPVQVLASNRRDLQNQFNHEWERLGHDAEILSDSPDLSFLRRLIGQIGEINETLLVKTKSIKNRFVVCSLSARVMQVALVAIAIVAALLLYFSSEISCREPSSSSLGWLYAGTALLIVLSPIATFIVQHRYEKISEEKRRVEYSSETEAREAKFLDKIVQILHDYQMISVPRGEVKNMLSNHSLPGLNKFANANEKEGQARDRFFRVVRESPNRYQAIACWEKIWDSVTRNKKDALATPSAKGVVPAIGCSEISSLIHSDEEIV